jgi:hypothetical protein
MGNCVGRGQETRATQVAIVILGSSSTGKTAIRNRVEWELGRRFGVQLQLDSNVQHQLLQNTLVRLTAFTVYVTSYVQLYSQSLAHDSSFWLPLEPLQAMEKFPLRTLRLTTQWLALFRETFLSTNAERLYDRVALFKRSSCGYLGVGQILVLLERATAILADSSSISELDVLKLTCATVDVERTRLPTGSDRKALYLLDNGGWRGHRMRWCDEFKGWSDPASDAKEGRSSKERREKKGSKERREKGSKERRERGSKERREKKGSKGWREKGSKERKEKGSKERKEKGSKERSAQVLPSAFEKYRIGLKDKPNTSSNVTAASRPRDGWPCFVLQPDLKALLFCVDLTSFTGTMADNPSISRSLDSMLYFQDICRDRDLQHVPKLVVFTKADLFRKAVQENWELFHHSYPSFESTGPEEPVGAVEHIVGIYGDIASSAMQSDRRRSVSKSIIPGGMSLQSSPRPNSNPRALGVTSSSAVSSPRLAVQDTSHSLSQFGGMRKKKGDDGKGLSHGDPTTLRHAQWSMSKSNVYATTNISEMLMSDAVTRDGARDNATGYPEGFSWIISRLDTLPEDSITAGLDVAF